MKTAFSLLPAVVCLWLLCTPASGDPPSAATRVYILDTGWIECDANWMVAMSVVGTKENPHPQIRWIKVPVYAVLIDHPEGKFLYDTGCSPRRRTAGAPAMDKVLLPVVASLLRRVYVLIHAAGCSPVLLSRHRPPRRPRRARRR